MSSQHLSDEAVAACADGVLAGHARDRATRHIASCVECADAVRVQREAAWALRAAPAPALPSGLFDRLCGLPAHTPVTSGAEVATVLAPDGSVMFSTMGAAAFVAADRGHSRTGHRSRPFVTTAAVVALAGALSVGSLALRHDDPHTPAGVHPVNRQVVDPGAPRDIAPAVFTDASLFGPTGN